MEDKLKLALFDCTTDTHKNKALAGVFTKDDYITATDGTVFIKLSRPFDFDETLTDKDGNQLPYKYPSIAGVIPEFAMYEPCTRVNVQDLVEACNLVPKSPDMDWKRIALNIDGVCLYPPRLMRVLNVFKAIPEEEAEVYSFKDRLVLKGKRCTAIIMSLGRQNEHLDKIENYTLESLKLMADLF